MPVDPDPDWQQRKRSSRTAGDNAFAREDIFRALVDIQLVEKFRDITPFLAT